MNIYIEECLEKEHQIISSFREFLSLSLFTKEFFSSCPKLILERICYRIGACTYYISHWGECNFTYFMNKSICDSSLIVIIHHKNNNLNCNSNFCVLHNKTGDFMTWTFEPPSRCYDINFWSRHRSFWSSSWRLSSPPSLGSLMNFFPKYKNNYKNI